MGRERRKQSRQRDENADAALKRSAFAFESGFANRLLLALALLAGVIAYWPVLSAGWFYDDQDYIVHDPRLDHIQLFLPGHWNDPPPPLEEQGISVEQMPGYGKPMIADRFVWRLSFAVERYLYGINDTPGVAHSINLLLHLLCVFALFATLKRLLILYAEEFQWPQWSATTLARDNPWPLLPGVSALIFAIHPWAAEPVCYVTARNGSLGALFALLCVYLTVGAMGANASWKSWLWRIPAILFFALAAFGSKENFISALPGCALLVAPIVWLRLRRQSPLLTGGIALAVVSVLLVALMLAIRSSDRAQGLVAQSSFARSWPYFFEIQNPLLLQTLLDQLPVRRISMEFNHPGWTAAACWVALFVNISLLAFGTIGGIRWPLFLALGWFYLHLLPTNTFLIRQDFLASRNVYLPVCGTAVLFAGAFLWLAARLNCKTPDSSNLLRRRASALCLATGVALALYWAGTTLQWARAFNTPDQVWARSAKIAPDHATVRINLGIGLLDPESATKGSPDHWNDVERELNAALQAETSPTMQYHNPSHRATRLAVANRIFGMMRRSAGKREEAARCFRDAWHAKPAIIGAWADWVDAAIQSNDFASLHTAVSEGVATWPGAWWPLAVRGILRATEERRNPLSAEAMADLQAAERAPDNQAPELRMLLIRSLFGLAQTENTRERRPELIARLKKLGLTDRDLQGMH